MTGDGRQLAAKPLLKLADIHKAYAGVPALRGATLSIQAPGAIHTLIGQNGCGKSSMLGVLSGQIPADRGEIRIDGRLVRFGDSASAVRHGIAMVSQETAVAEELTVAENILMGRMVRGLGGISWPASRRRAKEILARLGLDYDPNWVVGRLRPDQKQMVEIARAISLDTKVLILDEPTSSLTEDEVHELFAAIRELADRDVAILFVSHRLVEVFEISTEVTIMRDGLTVDSGPISNFTTQSLVDTMVGGVDLHGGPIGCSTKAAPSAGAASVLELRDLCSSDAVSGISLDLRPGKMIGIAGLVGSGRSELLDHLRHPADHWWKRSRRRHPDATDLATREHRRRHRLRSTRPQNAGTDHAHVGRRQRNDGRHTHQEPPTLTESTTRRHIGPAARREGQAPYRLHVAGRTVPERRQPAEGRLL